MKLVAKVSFSVEEKNEEQDEGRKASYEVVVTAKYPKEEEYVKNEYDFGGGLFLVKLQTLY